MNNAILYSIMKMREVIELPKRIRMCMDLVEKVSNYPVEIVPVAGLDLMSLGSAMLDAYRDTIDYEGEDLGQTVDELKRLFRGLYGPLVAESSNVIMEDGVIAAGLLVCLYRDEPTITYTFTRKGSRRRGYATILIEKAAEELRKKGYDSLCLYVTLENSDAVSLYESLGFYEVPVTSVTEIITD